LDAWRSLRTPDQTAESDAARIVLISLEGDTSEAAEAVKKQAEKAVKSFKGTDIRDRVAEETITSELGPLDYSKPFHIPTAVQDLAADVVTGPSGPPEIVPTFPPAPMWPPVEGVQEEVVPDTSFDMFTPGQDRGMVDPDQAYDPALVRFGVQGPVTPGDPVNEVAPDALPFDDFGVVPDQNTWKEGYWPPNLHEDWPARGAYPAQPQDPTAAPVFPTQVGKDADPILPQDLNPPLGEGGFAREVVSTFNIEDWVSPEGELPGAGDFLGGGDEEPEGVAPDEAPPAVAGEVPEEVPIEDGPITPEMIEQGPWQKTQMGFFAKDYRPSDLELDDQGQPITRPAGFFGDPVPPASVTPPPWLDPDDEASLEADVAREDAEDEVPITWATGEEELVDLDEDEEVKVAIDDEETVVEVEDERVSTGVRDAEREVALTEARDAILYLLQELERDEDSKGNIINVVGQDLYNKIEFANYTGDDIEEFYKKLLKHKDRIKRIDEETGTYYWNTIENIYRILVLGESG